MRPKHLSVIVIASAVVACTNGSGALCDCISPVVFAVDPAAVVDSAPAASSTLQVTVIQVLNTGAGELQWRARLAGRSAWAFLQPDSGRGGDSFNVRVDPTGLVAGTYRDSVVVTAATTGGIVVVPVTLLVQ